ncbi:peptide deformylase [Acetivibrio cellulolyticus]|uniref:peptide deformylase n=1 Tax=Acetivibrio cellulolyticus TaxID=35830 RepID=UPI0001E2DE33|nr:peptide deformylase [Acetivibrio cellulolyticus]
MALRNVRIDGDDVLGKVCRQVDVIDNRILILLKDMADTMYAENGVGLAAPQVGVLKRLVVIDVGEGLIELINPKIVKEEGEVLDIEGCLSVPELVGEVVRPKKVWVEALNTKGEKICLEGEDLLARAFCHEIDHLDGILFKSRAIKLINKKELKD